MNTHDPQVLNKIKALFESEALAVLATQKDLQPYASLLAFSVDETLEQIFFLTPSTTRKYKNLMASPRVALLIHNSRNQAEDIHNAIAITATGIASEISGSKRNTPQAEFLKQHPHLEEFATDPTTAMFSVKVSQYFLVSRFQKVVEINMMSNGLE